MSKKCKNCGEDLVGNYCYRCGQKASTGRITMRYFFHELEYGLTHADRKGLFFTLKGLFTRPGNMMRDYILGHRVNYFKPFPLLIILAGAYGILRHFIFPLEVAEVENEIPGEWLGKMPFLVYLMPAIKWMVTSQTFGVLVLLPFFALSVKKAFRRVGIKRYNYAECLYVSAYMACQRLIVSFLFLPLAFFADKEGDEPGMFWQYVLYFILSAWTFKQFFRINVKKAVWKTTCVGIYMCLFLAAIIFLLAGLIVWVLYMYKVL